MNIQYLLIASILFCSHLWTLKAETHFVNEWAAEIKGGEQEALRVAKRHGYEIVKALPYFDDHYLLRRNDVAHRSKRSSDHHTRRLAEDSKVEWAEQQVARSRVKRAAETHLNFDDPYFDQQWYIHSPDNSKRYSSKESNDLDLHVEKLWQRGLTGKGVKACVLDDGLEYTNPDILPNYDPFSSGDLNDNDSDPMPRYDPTDENKHGTRCAGEIAMVANNGICGVGIAPNASIGGVKMLDGKVTDTTESQSLTFNCTHVDIYSASWGPTDDGTTVEGPGRLAAKALEIGTKIGRNGKGVIYVWASGNGGRVEDSCNCDGYTSSIYTLSISSASEHGNKPWYGEQCASTMGTAYSSGSREEAQVVSTDLHHKCTTQHTGTSAAAPLAAGIIALILELNPSLTWRDVQHLIAWTSDWKPLRFNSGWYGNAAGLCVNPSFGFGLLNAEKLADAADPKIYINVPEKAICTVSTDSRSHLPQSLTSGKAVTVLIETDGCKGTKYEINSLEHVEVEITLSYSKRGNLGIDIISPSGTETKLLYERQWDTSSEGFHSWILMSVHTWGENPQGIWTLKFYDKNTGDSQKGTLHDVKLIMHGTKEIPHHMRNSERRCTFKVSKEFDSSKQSKLPASSTKEMSSKEEFLTQFLTQNFPKGLNNQVKEDKSNEWKPYVNFLR